MTRLSVEVYRSWEESQRLRRDWDDLVFQQNGGIDQLDLTSSFDWTMSLWESHLANTDQQICVLRDGTELLGILPLYRFRQSLRGIPCRSIAQFAELYGGRPGFLLRQPRLEHLDSLFQVASEGWDSFLATIVQGSVNERLLLDLARQRKWRWIVLNAESSPYIPLQESWAHHFASLPKKLRSTMRNGEKRLRECGALTYRECRSLDDIRDFNAAVAAIEQDSWKAAAGTSIASNPIHEAFHRALMWRAAGNRWASGHILLLNGEPLAYVMGLLHNGVFLDLKESYRASFREMSPGHVLKYFVFPRLYEHGTRLYDFMGKCEDYKMKWTDKTYSRATYLFFNRTLRARIASLLCGGVFGVEADSLSADRQSSSKGSAESCPRPEGNAERTRCVRGVEG